MTLLDYLQTFVKRWRLFAVCTLLLTVAIWAVSYGMPNQYSASTKLMPIGGSSSDFGASPLGGLAMMVGAGPGRTPMGQLIGLLRSRTLIFQAIQKQGLLHEVLGSTATETPATRAEWEAAVRRVRRMTAISKDIETNVLEVKIETTQPALAHKLVLGYIDVLRESINQSVLTEAKQQRIFLEDQLAKNEFELLELGKTLNEYYKHNHISNVSSSIDVDVSHWRKTMSAPVQTAESEALPSRQAFVQQWEALIVKKQKQEAQITGSVVRDVPQQVYLQYLTVRRTILDEVQGLLARQYALAKIEEAKEGLAFHVVDPPLLPIGPSSPNRKLILKIGFVASMFFALFIIFLREYIDRLWQSRTVRQ